ncbi:MAG: helix-turn-helix transcriptional regulator [Dehalococcoidia bacterium]|nr:helix-turn-helix transcriptional regulator [Dehalococcoidia bacterium]
MNTTEAMELRILRIRSGLRQYELAARVGVTQTKLSQIECGRIEPSTDLVARIEEAVKIEHSVRRYADGKGTNNG